MFEIGAFGCRVMHYLRLVVMPRFRNSITMADRDTEMNCSKEEHAQMHEEGEGKNEPIELSGWLMKRSRHSHKWKKQWFHLIRTDLFYGDSEKVITRFYV